MLARTMVSMESVERCFESLNLSEPDLVAEVHLDYVRAGADVVATP